MQASESVRGTDTQPSVCCLRPGVRIDAAEVLFPSLVPPLSVRGRRPGLKVTHLQFYHGRHIGAIGFHWVVHVCLNESQYF